MEPLPNPLAEGVDGGHVTTEGAHDAGVVRLGGVGVSLVPIPVQIGIHKGVLVPGTQNRIVLGDRAPHPVDAGKVRIGAVADQHSHRPLAHAGLGQKRLIDLPFREVEDAAVEVLDASSVPVDQLITGELFEFRDRHRCQRSRRSTPATPRTMGALALAFAARVLSAAAVFIVVSVVCTSPTPG